MLNNAHSLALKGLFNITTIVLWTQSPNASPGLCEHNVTRNNCSPLTTVTPATRPPPLLGVDPPPLLGDLGYNAKPVHVINHGQTSYPRVSDNDLLNYESVISRVPLLDIVATTHTTPLLLLPPTTIIPQITSIIHANTGVGAVAAAATTVLPYTPKELNNYWALLALILVIGTAAGNILVCLAITWERRLQNVTNYFLMSLAITDLMVAILVMPLGILTLFHGKCRTHHPPHTDTTVNIHIHMMFGSQNDYLSGKRISPYYECMYLHSHNTYASGWMGAHSHIQR